MIVSFERRFVYAAIPRTATHCFREALRPHLGPRDWEQCLLFNKKVFPVEPLARIGHGHITCQQLQPFLLPGFWQEAFRFCTVRNPFDRFVSACHFAYRGTDCMLQDPFGTMKRVIGEGQHRKHILFLPQHRFVSDENGRLLVDHVTKFEALQEGFECICRRLALPAVQLTAVNGSLAPPYQTCYDSELEEMVREAYRQDFEIFGYSLHGN